MTALENVLSYDLVQRLGWTLLHFLWQAAAVAVLVGILLRLLRKASASVRYIIACSALGLIVLLPAVTMRLVPVSAPLVPVNIEPAIEPPVAPAEQASEITVTKPLAYEEPVQPEPIRTDYFVLWKQRAAKALEPALPYIVTGWLLGVFGLSLWHLGGWAQLQRLRRNMVKPVDEPLQSELRALAERLGVTRAVQLVESALIQIPTVVGWLRPVILLPASALTGLNTEQLDAILAHELAHIKRLDYLVNMLQTVVEILGFYHPAVWWVSHKIRAERENCCDDLAVAVSGDRVCYAKALTSMEEIRAGHGELAVAATGGNLFSRIRRLIGKDSTERTFSWIPAVAVILLLVAMAIPTTLALTSSSNEAPNQTAIEEMLIDGFRENRDKFKCGFLAWTRTTKNNGFADQNEKYETKGSFQLWWDGKKIATKYVDEQVCRDSRSSRQWIKEQTGGNAYDGGLLSRKPKFRLYENWLEQIIHWTEPVSLDYEIPKLRKRTNISMDFSKTLTDGKELIKLIIRNIDENSIDYRGYSAKFYDPAKGYGLIKEEWYTGDDKLSLRQTFKLQEVIPGGWFPLEVDTKSFNTKNELHHHFALDLSRCSFNDPAAIPEGVFKFSTIKEHEQLNEILEKYSKGTTADEDDESIQAVCKSVENYIAAALAGEHEKATDYAHPESTVAQQTGDTREALQGQSVKILSVCSADWNALVISSVIRADHGRMGPVIFHVKKVIIEQKADWLIDDIDLETLDTIEAEIKRFLEDNPEAKTVIFKPQRSIINPDNHTVQEGNPMAADQVTLQRQELRTSELPAGWKLKRVSGIFSGSNTSALKAVPAPANKYDESWKQERMEFDICTLEGKEVETIHIMPGLPSEQASLNPEKYLLKYTRERGENPDNFKMRCSAFLIDLSRPGEYELEFTPKLGTSEIVGSLGGCYAINFEKTGEGPWIHGFAYQHPNKEYLLDGLPSGKYQLSAVTMRNSDNVLVSQEQVTLKRKDKVTVNITYPPEGNCSLKGNIFGKQKKYETPWPTWPESDGEWYVLIRKPGSGKVGQVAAYEALTVDSLYVVRKRSIVQETLDKARYHIEGLLAGEYTVTAIENPSWGGCTVTRQQSQTLILRDGDEAVLDFDLRNTPTTDESTLSQASANDDQPGRFGPVVELEIPLLINERDVFGKAGLIDFETGRIFRLPQEYMQKYEELEKSEFETHADSWYRENGIDAMAVGVWFAELNVGGVGLVPPEYAGNIFLQVSEASWDSTSPQELSSRLQQDKLKNDIGFNEANETFAFRTAEGSIGLLQFLAFDYKENSIKIRYKKVKVKRTSLPNADVQVERKEIWGAAVEGAQVRLVNAAQIWGRSNWPHPVVQLRLEARNQGEGYLQLPENGLSWQIEVDDITYEWVDPRLHPAPKDGDKTILSKGGRLLDFHPGNSHAELTVDIGSNWRQIPDGKQEEFGRRLWTGWASIGDDEYGPELIFQPGIHRLRVAITFPPSGAGFYRTVCLISNPVEIEILPEDEFALKGEDKKVESVRMLKELGLAVAMYADDHDKKLPDTLNVLRPYSDDEQTFDWILQNVEYLGKGKTVNDKPDTIIAYDRSLLQFGNGTNVLFLDAHVEFCEPERLSELGIESKKSSAEGNGTTTSATRQQMLATRLDELSAELNETESRRIQLEARLRLLDRNTDEPIPLQELVRIRQEYISRDPTIKALAEKMADVEMQRIVARQMLTESHPEVQMKAKLLEDLEKRLEELKEKANLSFDNMVEKTGRANQQELDALRAELQQTKEYEQRLRDTVTAQRSELAEAARRPVDSAKMLQTVGMAMIVYANDHEDKYPDSLSQLREYVKDEELQWASANVKYLGKTKTIADPPDTAIAYDKTLLTESERTNVFFNDGHVEFVKLERLKELGIGKTAVEIEARYLMVSEEFLKDFGPDANSIRDPNAWREPAPMVAPTSEDSQTYGLILDDQNVDFLLKAAQADEDAKMLAAPRVRVLEGEEAKLSIHRALPYVSGYAEPNSPSEEPEPIIDHKTIGTTCELTPHVIPDKQNILLEFKLEINQLIGFEERIYKDRYEEQVPSIETNTIATSIAIPDGKTLFLDGGTTTRCEESEPSSAEKPSYNYKMTPEKKRLIVLIKPTILSPEQAEAMRPPEPQPLDPNDPLVKELREKFRHSDGSMPGGFGGFGPGGPPPGPGVSEYGKEPNRPAEQK